MWKQFSSDILASGVPVVGVLVVGAPISGVLVVGVLVTTGVPPPRRASRIWKAWLPDVLTNPKDKPNSDAAACSGLTTADGSSAGSQSLVHQGGG